MSERRISEEHYQEARKCLIGIVITLCIAAFYTTTTVLAYNYIVEPSTYTCNMVLEAIMYGVLALTFAAALAAALIGGILSAVYYLTKQIYIFCKYRSIHARKRREERKDTAIRTAAEEIVNEIISQRKG